jgi:tape measure domain-containing protein
MTKKGVAVRLVAEGGGQVKAEFRGVGDSGEREFGRIKKAADASGVVMKRVFAILTAAVSVRQLVNYADTWTDLRSRVDLATGSQEAGAAVMERLSEMARRTYSSMELTTESFLANATALRELGLTTRESLDFTEALNNALVVSGARAQRAASVQDALSKAMALGTLQGQNLNTVIQTGGRVAELLAAELGVGVNELRRLGSQGEITGEVIRRALVGNLELLRDEADSMPATIGDAFTLLGNAALAFVGNLDTMLQASATVAQGIILMADNLDRVASYAAAAAVAFGGRLAYGLGLVAAKALATAGAMKVLTAALIRTGIGLLVVAAGELVYQFSRLVGATGSFGTALELMGNVAAEVWERIRYGAGAVELKIKEVSWGISAAWSSAVIAMADTWNSFVTSVSASPFWSIMPGMSGVGVLLGQTRVDVTAATANLELAERNVETYGYMTETLANAAMAPLTSLQALRDVVAEAADTTEDGAAAMDRLNDALADVGGGGGGGRGGGTAGAAADGLGDVADAIEEVDERAKSGAQAVSDMLADVIVRGQSAAEVISNLLAKMAEVQIQKAVLGLNDGGFLSGLFGMIGEAVTVPKYSGGGFTGNAPRSGGLDGQGGFMAMLHPQETVIDHTRGGGASQPVTINVNVAGARGDRDIMAMVEAGVSRGLAQYDRQMPLRVDGIVRDRRAR